MWVRVGGRDEVAELAGAFEVCGEQLARQPVFVVGQGFQPMQELVFRGVAVEQAFESGQTEQPLIGRRVAGVEERDDFGAFAQRGQGVLQLLGGE